MRNNIFLTNSNWAGFITRLAIGLILLPHGAQKVLGSFGGDGFNATMNYFTTTKHLPWLIAFLVIIIEFVGAISLIVGFASRIWAIAVAVIFTGMILISHLHNGFFMNWSGNQQGEGFEYHLLMISLALATFINGSGKFSIDKLIINKKEQLS